MLELDCRRRLVDFLTAGPGALEEVFNQVRVEEGDARGQRFGEEGAGRVEGRVVDARGVEEACEDGHGAGIFKGGGETTNAS